MIRPALRMADNDMAAPGVPEHGGADIAGMGAAFRRVAVLCAKGNRSPLKRACYGLQMQKRRTHQQIAADFAVIPKTLRNPAGQRFGTRPEAVHFPVSRYQGPYRHNFSSLMRDFL